jgi:hypothetical protein
VIISDKRIDDHNYQSPQRLEAGLNWLQNIPAQSSYDVVYPVKL